MTVEWENGFVECSAKENVNITQVNIIFIPHSFFFVKQLSLHRYSKSCSSKRRLHTILVRHCDDEDDNRCLCMEEGAEAAVQSALAMDPDLKTRLRCRPHRRMSHLLPSYSTCSKSRSEVLVESETRAPYLNVRIASNHTTD